MRVVLLIALMFLANIAEAIVPLGNTDGYIIVDMERQHKFTLNEGTLVECVLNVGDPGLKIETCKLDNASLDVDGQIYDLTHLVRNFMPLVNPGNTMYQYQYVGIWEKRLPDFTLRYRMVMTLNLPGLNTPRFGGFLAIPDIGFSKTVVAKKS